MNFLINSNEALNNYNINNTPKFSLSLLFKDELVKARVVNIYDGDTITCILPINNKYYNFKIRLAGIDTCEIKSKCEENKTLAIKAKKKLCQLIIPDLNIDNENNKEFNKELDKILNEKCYIIKIKLGDFDLYGRVLGWLFDKDSNIDTSIEQSFNNILINEHLAYSYQGKTKLTDSEQTDLLK